MIATEIRHAESLKSTKSVLGSLNSAILDSIAHGKRGDVKLCLSFLRKKSETKKSSVRPLPEEATLWSKDFQNLMASKYGQCLFKAFLQREFSEENVEFWLAVEDYKNTKAAKLQVKASKIHSDFVAVQSPKEINLDSTTRSQIESNLANADKCLFDAAQKRVQLLLESDSYVRFLDSQLYKELLTSDSDSSDSSCTK